jgi:hypothetical protein
MQFFTVTDQSNIRHKVLVVPLNQKEMNQLVGQCEKCMPSITVFSLMQIGHPYLVISFGGGAWKTAIALDQESEDGHTVGDELEIGDVLNVILTSEPKAMAVSKQRVYLNVPLESVLLFSILFTADIAENYAMFKMLTQPKSE